MNRIERKAQENAQKLFGKYPINQTMAKAYCAGFRDGAEFLSRTAVLACRRLRMRFDEVAIIFPFIQGRIYEADQIADMLERLPFESEEKRGDDE